MEPTEYRKHTIISSAVALALVGGLVVFTIGYINANPRPVPTPTPTVAVYEGPTDSYVTPATVPMTDAEREAIAAEQARIAAEAEAARLEAERIAAEEAARQAPQAPSAPEQAPPAPEPPRTCPGGSQSVGSDGYSDTGCLPDICFSIILPDPTHPECDAPFRP